MVLLLASRLRPSLSRGIALVTACLGVALAVPLWLRYDPAGSPYQMLEQLAVVPTVGTGYVVGADGLTVVLLLLIALGALAAVVSNGDRGDDPHPSRIAGLLLLHASMVGVVISLDAVLFVLCWAAMLATIGVLSAAPGRAARWRMVTLSTMSVATLAAGVVMIHAAAGGATGVRSFDVTKLQQVTLSAEQQAWPFILLLVSFGAGVWSMGSALVSGSPRTNKGALIVTAMVTLPAYGLVRLNLPILPQAARTFVPLLAGVALVTLAVAAVQAWRGREWARTVTWIAVGQLAAVLLGFTVIDPDALAGSLLHPVGVGLALAPLVTWRRLSAANNIGSTRVSRVSAGMLTLAAVGVPGLSGFVGASAVVRGAAHAHPIWALAAGGGLLALALGAVRQAWREPASALAGTGDSRWADGLLLAGAALTLLLGIAPEPLRARLQPTMARVLTRLDPGYAPAFSHVPGCGSAGPAPAAPAGFTAIAPCDNAASTPK